jgi:hypothetical protein
MKTPPRSTVAVRLSDASEFILIPIDVRRDHRAGAC